MSKDRVRPVLGFANYDRKRRGPWHRATGLNATEIGFKVANKSLRPMEDNRPICGAITNKRRPEWWHARPPTDTAAVFCGNCNDLAEQHEWDVEEKPPRQRVRY